MFKKMMLLSAVAFSLATQAQDTKKGFYLKAGGSYFTQTVATNFPEVGGLAPRKTVYDATGKMVSTTELSGTFGEGFRSNFVAGYRVTQRLGFEMGIHYYMSNSKTMADYTNRPDGVVPHPTLGNLPKTVTSVSEGQIKALDLSPSVAFYLGEVKDFEPYAKVGVIVPVYGYLNIETKGSTSVAGSKVASFTKTDRINPNPTLGFMSALGTSYKITNNLSAYAEVEYRNFTVKGKSKETTKFEVNGVDQLPTLPYSAIHSNFVDTIDANSNATGANRTIAKDELASYVSISGVGLSLGMRYNF